MVTDVTRAIIVNDNNTMGFEDAKSYVKFPLPTRILEVYLKRCVLRFRRFLSFLVSL